MGKRAGYLFLLLLRSPYEAFSTLLNALFLGYVFSAVQMGDIQALYKTLWYFALGIMLLYLYNGSIWTVYAAFIVRQMSSLRAKIFQHVSVLPMQTLDSQPAGEWFTRMNTDVQSVQALLSEPVHLPFLAVSIAGLVVSLVMLYRGEPLMTVLVLIFVIPHAAIGQLVIAKPMKDLSARVQQLTAENTSSLHSLVECAIPARLYDSEEWMLKHFENSSLKLQRAGMRVQLQGAIGRAVMSIMGLGGYLAAMIAGGYWIAQGRFDFPTLITLFQYRGGVIASVMMLLNSIMSIRISLAGVDRVLEVMHMDTQQ